MIQYQYKKIKSSTHDRFISPLSKYCWRSLIWWCNSKNNSTPEFKPLYDSRCNETSVAVACAAAAVAAATAAAARGWSCNNHLIETAWGTAAAAVLIIALKLLLLMMRNSNVFENVIVTRGIILLTLQIINRSIDETENDVHGICLGIIWLIIKQINR